MNQESSVKQVNFLKGSKQVN